MSAAHHLALVALAWTAACTHALAETIPPRGAVDPRVRVVAFNPDDVIKLHGYIGYQIHLQWAEGEEFVELGAGDVGGLDVGAERNHLFIKPKQEKVGTNLTVLTNRRTYHFDYSVSKAPRDALATRDMVYSIRFTYPQDEARRAAAEAERRRTEARMAQSAPSPRNDDYWYCGAASLRPTSAFDDGVHTHLRFANRAEFPAIFVRNDDNTESLLNFDVENDEVVIHRLARRFVLRRGQLVGCVENRTFDTRAELARNTTTVPGVQRDVRGGQP
jgi:type IV secretion system protein VirB9